MRLPVHTVVGLLLIAPLLGMGSAQASAAPSVGPEAEPRVAARMTTGKALLAELKVRAEHSGDYEREKFEHWLDVDNDCQNTRSEVLQRESEVKVTFHSARRCAVLTGRWTSWYDGRTWTRADALEVDHVVALGEAWKSGAWKWKKAKRTHYANDLGFAWSLDGITRQVNQDKGDQDPAEWLPARSRCAYARHWVAIKYRWGLSVDAAEKKALSGLLSGDCGRLKLKVPARGR